MDAPTLVSIVFEEIGTLLESVIANYAHSPFCKKCECTYHCDLYECYNVTVYFRCFNSVI